MAHWLRELYLCIYREDKEAGDLDVDVIEYGDG